MTFREIYKLTLDKLGLKEGDRATDNLIKSAINQAYTEIATLIPETMSLSYEEITDNIIFLPSDVLEIISVSDDDKGVLEKESYKVTNSQILLANYIDTEDKVYTVTYSKIPKALFDGKDKPKINSKYHMALYYYALFVYTDDDKYYNMYLRTIDDIEKVEFTQEDEHEESISDVYYSRTDEVEVI